MSTKKGKCNHDKFVQGQLGEECLKCGLLRTTIDYIEGYHQSEVVEWEKGVEHWAKEAREREISEAIKKMKTYTGGSSIEEKHKRVNKQEVLSIINK